MSASSPPPPPLPLIPPISIAHVSGSASASPASAPAASPAPAAASAPAAAPAPLPFITLTDIMTTIDSNIDSYVDELADRVSLTQIPVNGIATNSEKPKYIPAKDTSTRKIKLYEQMVYHRAGSANKNPLEVFIPTQYKINHQKISDYFRTNAGNNETKTLMTYVVSAYGNNYNSLFYKHTIQGKSATTGKSTGTGTGTGTTDLDPKSVTAIQSKIDKWHKDYTEWIFYDSASTFFIQERELPRDEMLTLKISVDDIFSSESTGASAGAVAGGVIKLVDEIAGKYKELENLYVTNGNFVVNEFLKDIVSPYIVLFQKVYADIELHLSDPIDYTRERTTSMGYRYDFEEIMKNSTFQEYT